MKKIKWNGDKLLGISAVVISLATLISLVYQAQITREHEMKSSFPKLELWNSRTNNSYAFSLHNTGVGPAIIESIHIEYADSIYKMDHAKFGSIYMSEYFENTDKGKFNWSHSNINVGRIIQSGEIVELISLNKDSIESHPIEDLYSNRNAQVVLKYSSVYQQQWLLEGMGSIPKLIDEEASIANSLFEEN